MNRKISRLIKKTDYDAQISKIAKKILDHNHNKYITTHKIIKSTADNADARLKK